MRRFLAALLIVLVWSGTVGARSWVCACPGGDVPPPGYVRLSNDLYVPRGSQAHINDVKSQAQQAIQNPTVSGWRRVMDGLDALGKLEGAKTGLVVILSTAYAVYRGLRQIEFDIDWQTMMKVMTTDEFRKAAYIGLGR